jgi:hypothetical protein
LSASVDLLRQSFTPNNTGLDKVMDIVKVSVDPNTAAVTLTNVIDNSQVTGTAGGTLTGTLTTPTVTEMSDLDQISSKINAFTAKFATGIPATNDPALLAFFDEANFLDDGRNLPVFLADVTDGTTIGMKASAFSLLNADLAGGKAEVLFYITLPKQNNSTFPVRWQFEKGSNGWVALGNQRLVKVDIHATGLKLQSGSQQWSQSTGITFSLSGLSTGTTAAKAVITGQGLSAGGVTLYNANPGSNFTFDPTGANFDNGVWFATDDAVAGAFPSGQDTNISYTVKIYDSNDALLDTYAETLTYRPYTPTELATAPFATITAPATSTDLAKYQLNVSQTVTWKLASGTVADYLQVLVYGTTTGTSLLEMTLLYNQTSATGTVTGTAPSSGSMSSAVYLSVIDSYKRSLITTVCAP